MYTPLALSTRWKTLKKNYIVKINKGYPSFDDQWTLSSCILKERVYSIFVDLCVVQVTKQSNKTKRYNKHNWKILQPLLLTVDKNICGCSPSVQLSAFWGSLTLAASMHGVIWKLLHSMWGSDGICIMVSTLGWFGLQYKDLYLDRFSWGCLMFFRSLPGGFPIANWWLVFQDYTLRGCFKVLFHPAALRKPQVTAL